MVTELGEKSIEIINDVGQTALPLPSVLNNCKHKKIPYRNFDKGFFIIS
jgi:hypothetical protein